MPCCPGEQNNWEHWSPAAAHSDRETGRKDQVNALLLSVAIRCVWRSCCMVAALRLLTWRTAPQLPSLSKMCQTTRAASWRRLTCRSTSCNSSLKWVTLESTILPWQKYFLGPVCGCTWRVLLIDVVPIIKRQITIKRPHNKVNITNYWILWILATNYWIINYKWLRFGWKSKHWINIWTCSLWGSTRHA